MLTKRKLRKLNTIVWLYNKVYAHWPEHPLALDFPRTEEGIYLQEVAENLVLYGLVVKKIDSNIIIGGDKM